MKKNAIDCECLLEKFPGKGGWTYARVPNVSFHKNTPFGWRRIKGSIDGYQIKNYHLMPMAGGGLFLPVKAEIRKAIGKKEGDKVRIILFEDHDPVEIPDEIELCLLDEPEARHHFYNFTESEKKAYIDWIMGAKTEATKIKRITTMLERSARGLSFYDRDPE